MIRVVKERECIFIVSNGTKVKERPPQLNKKYCELLGNFYLSKYIKYKESLNNTIYWTDDGLSPNEITPKFENCMDEAAKIVPLEKRNKTYIGLFATAGMRLLE